MLDLTKCDDAYLDAVRLVTAGIISVTPAIGAQNIMVVGATCRDVLQSALGHDFGLRATEDLDVAIALSGWAAYDELTSGLPAVRGAANGIRYRVAGVPVDLLPFGPVEDPTGTVTPQPRNEGMSVWAFQEVFEHSLDLPLDAALSVRLPSVPGYTALKLCAWLDRAEHHQYKDASDIAAAVYWYTRSSATEERLYDTDLGNTILIKCEMDFLLASAYLLGRDVSDLLGPERQAELAARWPGRHRDVLVKEMNLPVGAEWTRDMERRGEVLRGLEQGFLLR